ncbi:MAG: hypothetical protein AB7G87_02945 [Clostridia bacterium]
MAAFNKEVMTIITSDIFSALLNRGSIQVAQLNAAIALLIKAGIPFDVEFSPGTRRAAAAAELTIYMNPTTTLSFTLTFEAGPSIFGGGTDL